MFIEKLGRKGVQVYGYAMCSIALLGSGYDSTRD
jgi:hypothetical protein